MRCDSLLRLLALGLLLGSQVHAQQGRPCLVCEPLVRVEGRTLETQLLYGERVLAFEEKEGRRRVQAVEQPEFSHHDRWEGYPGQVSSTALIPTRKTAWWDAGQGKQRRPDLVVASRQAAARRAAGPDAEVIIALWLGTRLVGAGDPEEAWTPVLLLDGTKAWIATEELRLAEQKLEPDALRAQILDTARLFLGRPYLWGGRSSEAPDCSGLVNLSYRASGVDIPRDAHEQSLRARSIRPQELKPGDLIFTSRARNPKHVSHVMLYVGDGMIIEAERAGVREASIKAAVGLTLEELVAGKRVPGRVTCGRYLP